ncbi:MAG: hypothetical protein ACRENH_08235, partial [Gemmatimonadaceae bacterium]
MAALRKQLPNATRPRPSKQKLPAKPATSARSRRIRKEDPAAKQLRAAEIYHRLSQLYPDAHCEL